MRKKVIGTICSTVMVCSLLAAGNGTSYANNSDAPTNKSVKNVILFITDGMSLSDVNLARWYQGGQALAMDKYFSGLVRTYSTDSLTTDSAAGATAYATGHKVKSETVSILPDRITMPFVSAVKPEDMNKPLPTLMDAARMAGKSTGTVFTCELTDATPATFLSHAYTRDNAQSIAEQMVYSGVDVLLGGGSGYLVPGKEDINRKDGEDLTKILKSNGYEYVTDKAGLMNSKTNKIWGLFNPEALDADFDLNPQKQPSLAEMTNVAIEKLSQNENGFILMVEASQIDWYGHDNDPVGIMSETLAFDKAFKAAVDFAEKDGNTAVLSVSDHATGGLNMTNYDSTKDLISVLKKAKHTSYYIEGSINESNFKKVLADNYGLSDLTKEEADQVRLGMQDNLSPVIGKILGDKIGVTFSTDDHTSEEVGLFAYHPANFKPTDFMNSGVIQNTDVNKYIQEVTGLNLAQLQDTLYVSSDKFKAKGATITLDKTDKTNPVVVVKKAGQVLKLPIDKNIAIQDGKTTKLNVLTVMIKDKVWISQDALDLIL
ncbi:alkaline phosphatase [Paenibacillus sp. FSL R7-0048]|jgi:alkaline phosphatase|uniref:Alkaline phosphatase n=1 Tax=Paenibacillus odorifer TaxID=189426 RepID=A0ABX3GWG2_9BACL|nr:alkaline phosphatase [Paenibacillus odorifer]OMD39144.1 alkaline phosphatase [Paenibacillus odorifer]OMD70263.1 alkaline phosphatase [Paenibacillus odorifer]OMD77531.1 alkaline phosphatase [Paenibacillus odorifer]OMD85896.1 alkaline phosphatase [Paenibacillus odorifer]OMD91674.1 alkaline phosphatase [Paenibacillus odorifer]